MIPLSPEVRWFLDDQLPECGWVGRAEPIPRPPSSPDLNPLDFCGYVKERVYIPPLPRVNELKERISVTFHQ